MTRVLEDMIGDVDMEGYSPQALVVDITRQCTETCAHCVVAASPARREKLALNQVVTAIDDAANNGMRSVSFYGGEPFTAKQLLYNSISHAYSRNMAPQVMSNGYWGKTKQLFHRTFDDLGAVLEQAQAAKDGPVDRLQLLISTDDFHTDVSHADIARIVTEWLKRDEPIDLGLSIGTLDPEKDDAARIFTGVLDEFDAQNKEAGIISAMSSDLYGQQLIRFVDKELELPTDLTPEQIADQLKQEDMLPEADPHTFVDGAGSSHMEYYRLLKINGAASLVQNPKQRERGVFQVGRFVPGKQVPLRTYSISLFGQGRDLLDDPEFKQKAVGSRLNADIAVNIHELRSLLLLGNDNQFYVTPIQLQHQARPLGVNDGNGVARSIQRVADGEPVSNILINQDGDQAVKYASAAGQLKTADRIRELFELGLVNEAMEEFVSNEEVMAFVEQEWDRV